MGFSLRRLAKGKECQLRLHEDDGTPICNFDPATVVLAHIRCGGVGGVSKKPPVLFGVWACSSCHDVIDSRRKANVSKLDSDILAGVCRTLSLVSKELGLD